MPETLPLLPSGTTKHLSGVKLGDTNATLPLSQLSNPLDHRRWCGCPCFRLSKVHQEMLQSLQRKLLHEDLALRGLARSCKCLMRKAWARFRKGLADCARVFSEAIYCMLFKLSGQELKSCDRGCARLSSVLDSTWDFRLQGSFTFRWRHKPSPEP